MASPLSIAKERSGVKEWMETSAIGEGGGGGGLTFPYTASEQRSYVPTQSMAKYLYRLQR